MIIVFDEVSSRVARSTVLVLLAFILFTGCRSAAPTLRGTVLDGAIDTPLPLAHVKVLAPEGTPGTGTVITDEQGRFEWSLDVGTFEVIVSAPGFVSATLEATFTKDTLAQEHEIRLKRRRLAGSVRDDTTGEPISGAQVIYGAEQQLTTADGRFAVEALEEQSLVVSAAGYLSRTILASDVAAAFDEQGHLRGPLDIALPPRVVTGRITEAGSGRPIPDVLIAVDGQEVYSDADGTFTLRYIEPGMEMAYESAEHRPGPAVVYAEQEQLDLTLEPWQVEIAVVDADTGEPLDGAQISVADIPAVVTDEGGMASVQTRPGITLTVQQPGYIAHETGYEGQPTLRVELPPSRLSGMLRDGETGQPITHALVLAYAVSDPLAVEGLEPKTPITMVWVDADGRFVLDDVLDVASLIVKAPGYARRIEAVEGPGVVDLELEPFQARGIYIPFGLLSLPDRIAELLDLVDNSVLNSVVVDVKGDRARIAWDSPLPLAQEIGAYQRGLMDLREFIRECHARDIYVIARIVVFKDDVLATHRPEWAVTRENGEFYKDQEGLYWVDPFLPEVRAYTIDLAREVVAMGVDEIQLDYIRFPSDGNVRGLVYSQEATFESRTALMDTFCAEVAEAIRPTPAFVSADIFGLTVWVDPGRDMGIGQRVDDIAPHMDYLSPMLYPTTFGPGNLGFDNPGLYPYEVIYHSVLKSKSRTITPTRPWLQHYSIGGIDYNETRLLLQRRAAEDAGADGWIFWNSRGRYLPEVMAENAAARVEPPPIKRGED
jgi:hypothetical protein